MLRTVDTYVVEIAIYVGKKINIHVHELVSEILTALEAGNISDILPYMISFKTVKVSWTLNLVRVYRVLSDYGFY